jgi:hypothetical protein
MSRSLTIADIIPPDGRIFLRPEFGRIGQPWPCIAFRLLSELEKLASEYKEGRDIALGTGTVNPENTRDPTYRGKILTAAMVEARYAPTQEVVPPASWAHHCRVHGGEPQWPHCLPARRIFNIGKATSPYPKAGSFMPVTYRQLSYQFGRGRAAGGALLVTPEEQRNLMHLPLAEVTLAG